MINSIEIEKFSGIDNLRIDDIDGRNVLIYGSNGSGKSSIIDAFYYLKGSGLSDFSKKGRNQIECLSFCGCGDDLIKVALLMERQEFVKKEGTAEIEYSNEGNFNYLNDIQILRKDRLQEFLHNTDADRYRGFLSLMGLEMLTAKLRSFDDKILQLRNDVENKKSQIRNKFSSVRFANLSGENFKQLTEQYLSRVSTEFNEYEIGDNLITLKEKYSKVVNERTKENIRIINENISLIGASLDRVDINILNNLLEEVEKINTLKKEFPENYLLNLMNEAISVFDNHQLSSCPICTDDKFFNQSFVYESLCDKRKLLTEIIQLKEKISNLIAGNKLILKIDNAILVSDNILKGEYMDNFLQIKNFVTNFEEATLDQEVLSSVDGFFVKNSHKKEELSRELGKLINNKVEVLSSVNDILLRDEQNWKKLEDDLNDNIAKESIIENLRKLLIESRDSIINEIFEKIEHETIHLYKKMNQRENELKEFKLKKLRASSLQLGVDFLNFEKVDPLSVLSTGHLDLFGLAMFLATIKTFYPTQTLIVLEDVIDSNDNEHKSNFMECILDEFNDYRFIVTTHLSSFYETFKDQITSREINKKWATIELGEWDGNVGVNILRCNNEVLMGGNHIVFIDANLNRDNYKNIGGALRKLNEIFLKKVSDKKKIQVRYNKRQQFTSGDFMGNELKRELRKDLIANGSVDAEVDTLMNDYFGNQKIINWLSHDSAVGDELALSEVEKFVKALKLLISKEREFKALP